MANEDYTATVALKRDDPLWYRIRKAATLPTIGTLLLACLTGIVTGLVQFHNLRNDVTALGETFKTSKAQGEEIATLRQQVADLDRQVQAHQERWDYLDRQLERPDPRLRRSRSQGAAPRSSAARRDP